MASRARLISSEDGRHASKEGGGGEAVAVRAVEHKSVISALAKVNNCSIITAENYYLLYWLYRIRRASCARELRIGFLQPDFLCIIYGPMMRSPKKLRRTNEDIKAAANLWCSHRSAAEERYGHISDWDVSSVTDMGWLFNDKAAFDDDISRWDVSNVIYTRYMFSCASAFNQAVGDWDVSNVNSMEGMFSGASAFNQAIGNWEVSKVTNTSGMFAGAYSFNQPIGNWDVSSVVDMDDMFFRADAFNQSVGNWDVSKVTNMEGMFAGAMSFNQSIGNWDVSKVKNMHCMFVHANAFNQDLTRWDMRSVTDTKDMFSSNTTGAMSQLNIPAEAGGMWGVGRAVSRIRTSVVGALAAVWGWGWGRGKAISGR